MQFLTAIGGGGGGGGDKKHKALKCPTGKPHVDNTPPVKFEFPSFDNPNSYKNGINKTFSLFGHGFHTQNTPAEYKTIQDKTPIPDEDHDNMLNVDGGEVTDKVTGGKSTRRNTAVNTIMGFLSDVQMGKGSKFVVNNNLSDIKSEFIQELDADSNGTVSKNEFTTYAEKMEKSKKGISEDYYGKNVVQYSKEKVDASFEAISQGDGEISKDDFSGFFDKVSHKSTYKRDGENFTNVSQIDFQSLPENMQKATKTETVTGEHQELVKEASSETTQIDGGSGELFGASYNKKVKNNKIVNISNIETNENNLKMLQILNNHYNGDENAEALKLSDLQTQMKEQGISEEETNAILTGAGLNPSIENFEVGVNDPKGLKYFFDKQYPKLN